jgi:hypothetical protein
MIFREHNFARRLSCSNADSSQLITANWELVLGNSYAYTVLSAFGLFYAGFGFIVTPSFGVRESYATEAEYYNALGFFVLSKSRPKRCHNVLSQRY